MRTKQKTISFFLPINMESTNMPFKYGINVANMDDIRLRNNKHNNALFFVLAH